MKIRVDYLFTCDLEISERWFMGSKNYDGKYGGKGDPLVDCLRDLGAPEYLLPTNDGESVLWPFACFALWTQALQLWDAIENHLWSIRKQASWLDLHGDHYARVLVHAAEKNRSDAKDILRKNADNHKHAASLIIGVLNDAERQLWGYIEQLSELVGKCKAELNISA